MGDVLRLVFVHLLESSNFNLESIASLLWRSMTNSGFEKIMMVGDIAICLYSRYPT